MIIDSEIYSHFHNIWGFLMLYQIFLSPQVKWSIVISYKQGIYELYHELLNDSRLWILGYWEKSEKS